MRKRKKTEKQSRIEALWSRMEYICDSCNKKIRTKCIDTEATCNIFEKRFCKYMDGWIRTSYGIYYASKYNGRPLEDYQTLIGLLGGKEKCLDLAD